MRITSHTIKTGLLAYYRFKCGAQAVSTELSTGIGIADIVVINRDSEVIEIEVKTSKADLLKEATSKSIKHIIMERVSDPQIAIPQSYVNARPHRFYFCVTEDLREDAIEFTARLNPKYGVMVFNHSTLPQESITIAKPSHKLHNEDVSKFYFEYIMKRNSNELTTFYIDEYWEKEVPKRKPSTLEPYDKKKIKELSHIVYYYQQLLIQHNIPVNYDNILETSDERR